VAAPPIDFGSRSDGDDGQQDSDLRRSASEGAQEDGVVASVPDGDKLDILIDEMLKVLARRVASTYAERSTQTGETE
jgi:hypothetical protein